MRLAILVSMTLLLLMGCSDSKKKTPTDAKKSESENPTTPSKTEEMNSADTTKIEELVYDAMGASKLRTESAARSDAELNGRKKLIKVLADDAVQLMQSFYKLNPEYFDKPDTALFAKKIQEAFKKSTTLKGSAVSEYSLSPKKDTTYASLEMPLMNGYEAIEKVVVETGAIGKFLKPERIDDFRKNFHNYFMAMKKKLLTEPS